MIDLDREKKIARDPLYLAPENTDRTRTKTKTPQASGNAWTPRSVASG